MRRRVMRIDGATVRAVAVDGRWVVLAPFVGAAWVQRDGTYRRRRVVSAVIVLALTLVSVGLTALYVTAIARPSTPAAVVFATCYTLLTLVGAVAGRRWLARTPRRRPRRDNGVGGFMSVLFLVFMPVIAGFSVVVLAAMFAAEGPGERRARELTVRLSHLPADLPDGGEPEPETVLAS